MAIPTIVGEFPCGARTAEILDVHHQHEDEASGTELQQRGSTVDAAMSEEAFLTFWSSRNNIPRKFWHLIFLFPSALNGKGEIRCVFRTYDWICIYQDTDAQFPTGHVLVHFK